MNTLLVFGASGQLGAECVKVLAPPWQVVALSRADADLGDPRQCRAALDRHAPAAVLNAAAYTRVDDAQSRPQAAYAVNAEAPKIMAEWVEAHRAWLVHVSTDFVFDGKKPRPQTYDENDRTAPLSVYGQSKLAGENAIRETTDRYAILRTAWLYGRHGSNFPKTMLRLARRQPHKDIAVVADQYGTPTWARRLALQIARVVEVRARGLFHASSDGSCSWHEFACAFLDTVGVPHRIVPCPSEDYPVPAPRPRNSVLRNRALQEAGLDIMPHWRDDMESFIGACRSELLEAAKP
jgi:dTDP-4-dehydrorhamnose reductase